MSTTSQTVQAACQFPYESEHQVAVCDVERHIADSGASEGLDRTATTGDHALLTPEREAVYGAAGFSRNFLWYAPQFELVVGAGDQREWTACVADVAPGETCQGAITHDAIGNDVVPGVSLTAIGYHDDFIILACGNYSFETRLNGAPTPTPVIRGVKFRDDDRDGQRDASEDLEAGWTITLSRVSSLVGQATGVIATTTTDANGNYRFALEGQGPGQYVVEESPQAGWTNYTPSAYTVNIGFGVGDAEYVRDFGNAETTVDIEKVEFVGAATARDGGRLEVGVPFDLVVDVVIANNGAAEIVDFEDHVDIFLPVDCVTATTRKTLTGRVRRDFPERRTVSFEVSCSRPSNHDFRLVDTLVPTTPGVHDTNLVNNSAERVVSTEIWVDTDMSIVADLSCVARTDVGEVAECVATATVTNTGFGPLDGTVGLDFSHPADCTSSLVGETRLAYPALADGETRILTQPFTLVCTHRSFHDSSVVATVAADDPHVTDTNADNNSTGSGPVTTEVFHDASMSPSLVHLACDEQVGDASFVCTATTTYSKSGPAPDVESVLAATLSGSPECVATEGRYQDTDIVVGQSTATAAFTWTITCPSSGVLHPFSVEIDLAPAASEPHAVDTDTATAIDNWIVPYCRPTVNPHGQHEPQAPGNGMNEDGFYVFGTMPSYLGGMVSIRDTESDAVFGPFAEGTRIKVIEANGAEPWIDQMAGNNGNRRGQANAVDYRLHLVGDAEAFFVDEAGVEVSMTCYVPPFPK